MNHENTASKNPLRRSAALALTAAVSVTVLAACGGGTSGTSDGDGGAGGGSKNADAHTNTDAPRVLWMGDSIAGAEAPALGAALKAGAVPFKSMAADGGGGVVGDVAGPTWDELPKELASFKPDVVAYQITTYDWGTPDAQRAAYDKLAKTVGDAGADLVLVTAPPFKIDTFYKPHAAEIKTAPKSAAAVADRHKKKVHFLDAAALWGTDGTAPKAQRSKDGVHSCQQGSAAFAQWLTKELGRLYSFTPAPADQWATGSWTGSKVYGSLGCK
ncbi:SGNH/GDSL hydrolase family protein [Streptomyces venezuelae]|uniref:SGNH/GDSL hydrolase family protein n=1 Tax=Streptomyces venezuelae TaxID=54571 RepID=A0A5P2CWQ4_STRVZ|nr:SGNH/GDSL hydrolase family protein [Streptomyces venezuelae]QES45541.1 SGNH/GDSL hydrolase family protein [Streptomyces venezuelae]